MIIDSHVHLGRGERLNDTWQVDNSPEQILAYMDESGIDISCIMPVIYSDYEAALEEIRDAVRSHSDRFIGYARVNLVNDEERALRQIRKAFDEYGFRGTKIHQLLGDGYPTRRFMDLLSEYGYPLLLHTPADVSGIDAFARLARAYPKVPVVCGHMGGYGTSYPGFVKLCAVEANQIPNLYLDTAFVFVPHWIRMAVEICGPEKVLFGSDSPDTHPAIPLKQIEVCHFTDSERELILSGNMRRLLRL